MEIQYWSDYACPYCYIGETRLKNAIKSMGLEDDINLTMHAFELDPTAAPKVVSDTASRFARKYGLTLDEAKERIEGISELGRAEGIDFRYAETQYSNTFDAHRLTKYAHSVGNTAIEGLLFKAYFTDGMVLADHGVLIDLAVQAGLDEQAVADVLSSDAFADEVRADENEARQLGVTGVPFFVLDGKLAIPGCFPEDGFKQAITQTLNDELAAMAAEGAAACGPDGCAPAGAACGPEGCEVK